MKIWLDAQISPAIAQWLSSTHGVEASPVKDFGLRDATDRNLFLAAREANAVVLTKDRDLVDLVIQLGQPPKILWLTCGNTSNATLKTMLDKAWPTIIALLESGEPVIEISDTTP